MNSVIKMRIPGADGAPGQDVYFHPTTGIHNVSLPPELMCETSALQILLMKIQPYESLLIGWLAKSASNAAAFASSPLSAIESSGIGIPPELLAELKQLSEQLVQKAGVQK